MNNSAFVSVVPRIRCREGLHLVSSLLDLSNQPRSSLLRSSSRGSKYPVSKHIQGPAYLGPVSGVVSIQYLNNIRGQAYLGPVAVLVSNQSVWPRSIYLFHAVSYYLNLVKTSWT